MISSGSLRRACVAVGGALAIGLAGSSGAMAHTEAPGEHGDSAIAPGACVGLRSLQTGNFVVRTPDGFRAAAGAARDAEPLRSAATGLGRFMLLDSGGSLLSAGALGRVVGAVAASGNGDWRVLDEGEGVRFLSMRSGRQVAVADDGRLVLRDGDSESRAGLFAVEDAQQCADVPEPQTNVTGEPSKGDTPFGEVRGFLDTHLHGMAFEFLGGRAHCGKPWDPMGVTVALRDCPDHEPNGAAAVLENFLRHGSPVGTHDPVGWPTFKDWPAHDSLTHEGTYYKWIERAWRAGQRIMVNLLVDNEALCTVYPLKKNRCNDMESVRLQARRLNELQDYVDAQWGGPGKGWLRIVRDPFEARRVINDGKLAVVMGIEVSRLFGCGEFRDVPQCSKEDIDQRLQEVHDLGVRDMELVNKFDNGLAGVAFDGGPVGVLINLAQFYESGHFWELEPCPTEMHDNEITPSGPNTRDVLLGAGLEAFAGSVDQVPPYPPGPHCNKRGLTALGAHLVRRMIERGMIIDPDHMSVKARHQALDIIEAEGYSGVVSSHSWSDAEADKRILRAGGIIGPYAGGSAGFVGQWRAAKAKRDERFFWGIGFGPDMNGFGAQGGPRQGNEANPVEYPFRSFDGKQLIDRQVSGERVYDINVDGVAHYGLYPDWVEDVRKAAGADGEEIVEDMARGAEAYLQMWERAVGARSETCLRRQPLLSDTALGDIPIGALLEGLLREVGQPLSRLDGYEYCVAGEPGVRVVADLSPAGRVELVLGDSRTLKLGTIKVGSPAGGAGAVLGSRTTKGIRTIHVVRKGRVRAIGLVGTDLAADRDALRRAVSRATRAL